MKRVYKVEDYIGKKFGKWTILEDAPKKYNLIRVKCKCECGKENILYLTKLIRGKTICCKKCSHALSKYFDRNILNGRLYHIWSGMKNRCKNFAHCGYKYYGAKGIKVCDEWLNNFENFYNWAINNGYNDTLTIDRINTKGNYEPNNCRWISREIQSINKIKQKNNISGYTGISYHKKNKKWASYVIFNKKHIHLGLFNTQKEALEARNKYIICNHLEHPIQEYKGEIVSVNKQ